MIRAIALMRGSDRLQGRSVGVRMNRIMQAGTQMRSAEALTHGFYDAGRGDDVCGFRNGKDCKSDRSPAEEQCADTLRIGKRIDFVHYS